MKWVFQVPRKVGDVGWLGTAAVQCGVKSSAGTVQPQVGPGRRGFLGCRTFRAKLGHSG